MPETVPLKGRLKDNSLPKLLNYLSEIKGTGTLTLASGGLTKRLFLQDGGIIFASSTYEGDRLGELLLKAGKLNVAQFEAASKVVVATGKRMGGVMVELGFIKPKDLFWGVKYQVQEIVCSLFTWTDGEYEFVPGELPGSEVITLHMSTANLIIKGIKRIDDWTRISRGIPSMDTVLCVTSNPLKLYQDVDLTQEEKNIISLFDGQRTIKQVFDQTSIGDFEALKAVYVLYTIGIIEQAPVGGKSASRPAPPRPVAAQKVPALDKDAIHKAYTASRGQNHYQLLGLNAEASTADIEAAYHRLAKLYHPDQQFREGMASAKDELGELFGKVTEAYKILSDDSRRWEYDLSLSSMGSGEPKPRPATAKDPAKAREAFAKGIDSFRDRDFESATVHFKEATRHDSTNATYLSHLALALLQRPRREAEAEEAMLEALRLEPKNADHHANLGLLYQKTGIKDKAKESFEAALKIDPENKKALKGLKKR